jgi:hypothetical protein
VVPVSIRSALVTQESALTAGDPAAQGTSAFAAAAFAYGFLFRRFWLILRVLAVPILTAGIVLDVCLSAYISELLLFLKSPGPQAASVALGTLAAGIFLSLFCYSVAVSSVIDILSRKPQIGPWALVKTKRQEWRVYAAYLRLLLIISACLLGIFLIGSYVFPLAGLSPSATPWVLTVLSAVAAYWLTAQIGFVVAPVIAAGDGPVLRAAWSQGSRSALRNCLLIALLAAPGCLLWFLGELLFRVSAISYATAGSTLADYANAMAQTLGQFVALASASVFVSIILLTAGAMHAYRQPRLAKSANRRFLAAAEALPK